MAKLNCNGWKEVYLKGTFKMERPGIEVDLYIQMEMSILEIG